MATDKKKVKSILISQPKPEVKSPYAAIEKKYKLKIDYRPLFMLKRYLLLNLENKELVF